MIWREMIWRRYTPAWVLSNSRAGAGRTDLGRKEKATQAEMAVFKGRAGGKALTCFLNRWHSSGVRVSALAISGMTLTFSCSRFMNSTSSGFSLRGDTTRSFGALGLDWSRLDWTSPDWTGLYCTSPHWTELDFSTLDWISPDWTGLNWTSLDWTSPTPPGAVVAELCYSGRSE